MNEYGISRILTGRTAHQMQEGDRLFPEGREVVVKKVHKRRDDWQVNLSSGKVIDVHTDTVEDAQGERRHREYTLHRPLRKAEVI